MARASTMLGMPGPNPRAFGAMIFGRPHASAATPAAAEAHCQAPMGCPASRINDGASVTAMVGATGTGGTSPSPASNPACTRRSPGTVMTNETSVSGTMTANTRRQSWRVSHAAMGGPTKAGSSQQKETNAMMRGRSTAGNPCATITVSVRFRAPAPRPWMSRASRSTHTDGASQPMTRPMPNMAKPT